MIVSSPPTPPSPGPGFSGNIPGSPPLRPIRISTLVAFFILAFTWTWLFWGAMALWGIPYEIDLTRPGVWLILLGQAGPLVAALALTVRSAGWPGVRSLLTSPLHARFRIRWYLAVLFGPGALLFLAIIIAAALGIRSGVSLLSIPAGGWLLALAGQIWVVIGEEYGWRGYALPRLQDRFGSLTAALGIGLFWGLWHLPLFFVPLSYQAGVPFVIFLLGTLFDSVIYALVYNRTGRRLLSVMLLHGAQNLWGRALPLPPGALWIYLFLEAGLAVVAVRYLPRPLFHNRTLPSAPASGLSQRPLLGWLRKIGPRRRGQSRAAPPGGRS